MTANSPTPTDHDLDDTEIALLTRCRAALDHILTRKPMLAAMYYTSGARVDTIGNLRAELGPYRLPSPPTASSAS
jgi:hypothetical protein